MHTKAAPNLLEYLAEKIHCSYLSDLHNLQYHKELLRILETVKSCDYSLVMWNDAVFYITSEKRSFQETEEAKKFITAFLSNSLLLKR